MKSSQLACGRHFKPFFVEESIIDNVAKISAEAVASVANKVLVNAMAVACGLAMAVFVCIATTIST